jgi:hypothetical protein
MSLNCAESGERTHLDGEDVCGVEGGARVGRTVGPRQDFDVRDLVRS